MRSKDLDYEAIYLENDGIENLESNRENKKRLIYGEYINPWNRLIKPDEI